MTCLGNGIVFDISAVFGVELETEQLRQASFFFPTEEKRLRNDEGVSETQPLQQFFILAC